MAGTDDVDCDGKDGGVDDDNGGTNDDDHGDGKVDAVDALGVKDDSVGGEGACIDG